jgi:hypothetical protein
MNVKINFSKYLHVLLGFSLLFSSCALNGKYCTPSGLSVRCLTFDRKNKIFINEFAGCLGGEIKKGKYKRLGNLLIVDLAPYEFESKSIVKFDYQSTNEKDSIEVQMKIIDITKEDVIDCSIIFFNENKKLKYRTSSDIEGKSFLKIAKNTLPLKVEVQYLGYEKVFFDLKNEQNCFVNIEMKDDKGFIQENRQTGREFYHIKRIAKDSFACKQIYDLSEWKFDKEQLENRMAYYRKIKRK